MHLQRLAEELDVNHRGVTLDYLAFVDVVDEALGWLAAPNFDWSNNFAAHPRLTLCAELSLGLANVGPKTRDFLGARVERAEGATAVWATGSVASGVSDRSELRLALEDLRDCLSTPNGLAAVWSDLTAFYESGACEWERTERVIDFLATARVVGHGDTWFRSDLVGIIQDARHAVSSSRRRRDGSDVLDFGDGPAGSTLDEMNELLEIHLTKPAARGHCVVWLDFDEASLGDVAYVHAGDVQYWQAAYGSELVEGDVDLLDSDLSELRPTEHRVVAPPRRDRVDPNTVWARVDLGKRLAAGAVQDAEEQALLLADLASVYVGGPRWTRGGWRAVLLDGRSAAGGGFGRSARQLAQQRPFDGHMDAVGRQLTSLVDAYFAGKVNPAAGRVAKLWADVEDHQEPAQRVLATVRMLEGLLPGGLGNRSLKTQLPSIRAAEQQNDVFSGPLAEMANAIAREDVPWKDDAAAKFGDALPKRWPRFYHHEIVPMLPELQRRLSEHQRFGADVRHSLALMSDQATAISDLELLRERFRIAWGRVVRYRNAITHGSPAPAATGTVAQATADWVGQTVLDAALRGAHDGRPTTVELQRAAEFRRRPGWES